MSIIDNITLEEAELDEAKASEEQSDEELVNTVLGDDSESDEDVESEDSLTFSSGVIEKIVALGLRDVPGVVGMKGHFLNRVQDAFGVRDMRKGVQVEVDPDSSVRVYLSILMAYGAYAPKVFEDVKHAVVDAVTGMTGLEVAGVNLRIEDVLTPEEIEERAPKLPAPEALEELPAAEIEADDTLAAELEAAAEAAE